MSKYSGQSGDLNEIIAGLIKRVQILETVGHAHETSTGVATDADYNTPPVAVTSGTFVTTFWLWPNGRRFGIEAYLRVVTDGSTTMEVELFETATATVISPVATVPTGTTGFLGLRGRTASSVITGSVEVRARRASGAGTARIGVLRVQGGDFRSEQF